MEGETRSEGQGGGKERGGDEDVSTAVEAGRDEAEVQVEGDGGRGRRGSRARAQELRLTARDHEMIRWLGRHRFATARQLGLRFVVSESAISQRLRRLASRELVAWARPLHGRPTVWLATGVGLATVGSHLGEVAVDIRTFHHDLGVTEIAVDLERRGFEVLSEREIRAAEAHGEGTYAVRLGRSEERRVGRHWPDLAVRSEDGRLWALELELVPKRTTRLTQILEHYRWAEQYSAVLYYVPKSSLRERLEQLVGKLGLNSKIAVRAWKPPDEHTPD